MRRKLLHLVLPLFIVYAYRAVPAGVRGAIGRRIGVTRPTSHIAVRDLKAGLGWPAFWSAFWSCGRSWE